MFTGFIIKIPSAQEIQQNYFQNQNQSIQHGILFDEKKHVK